MLVFQIVTSCPLSLPSRRSRCPRLIFRQSDFNKQCQTFCQIFVWYANFFGFRVKIVGCIGLCHKWPPFDPIFSSSCILQTIHETIHETIPIEVLKIWYSIKKLTHPKNTRKTILMLEIIALHKIV